MVSDDFKNMYVFLSFVLISAGLFCYGIWQKYRQRFRIASFVFMLVLRWCKDYKVNTSFQALSNCAVIQYKGLQKEYSIYVPYKARYVPRMLSFEAILHITSTTVVNITQQPGIPYLFTAEHLGGTHITITNTENGKTAVFTSTSPGYAEELW